MVSSNCSIFVSKSLFRIVSLFNFSDNSSISLLFNSILEFKRNSSFLTLSLMSCSCSSIARVTSNCVKASSRINFKRCLCASCMTFLKFSLNSFFLLTSSLCFFLIFPHLLFFFLLFNSSSFSLAWMANSASFASIAAASTSIAAAFTCFSSN